ncbi:MAG: hypothetical protein MJ053_02695 [Elusimicrobiaceae bacterium]|nr:hypothetical protein [Elusimicrobiaceae bacterium]
MKKLFIASIFIFSFTSTFAQKPPIGPALVRRVGRQIVHASAKPLNFVPIVFTNIQTAVPSAVAYEENLFKVPATINSLQATALHLDEVRPLVRKGLAMYLPFPETAEEKQFYRGMGFNTIEDLHHLLVNGLEVKRSSCNVIYTALNPRQALAYAVPSLAQVSYEGRNPHALPILLRIHATAQLFNTNEPDLQGASALFQHDIPSSFFDVFVFMNIDGQSGWYQVTLSPSGELQFVLMENYETKKGISGFW